MREGTGIEIITGLYGKGTPEENELVTRVFGDDRAAAWFELYFYWYNLIHELGHGVMWFYCNPRPHPVEEEVLVNQFAVAYWRHYGETEKLAALKDLLAYALQQYVRPTDKNAIDYAKEAWDQKMIFNFNNYGWFQMSCVADIMQNPIGLHAVLEQMGVPNVASQPEKLLRYDLNDETPTCIVRDAAAILREWGAELPDVHVSFDNDPNRHMSVIHE